MSNDVQVVWETASLNVQRYTYCLGAGSQSIVISEDVQVAWESVSQS